MIGRASRIVLVALLLSATGAGAQHRQDEREGGFEDQDGGPGGLPGAIGLARGDPSAIVAAEFAFKQLAREDGQWTAFRKTADKDAVMFVPQAVNAQRWLKKRAEPAQALSWSPQAVYVSCDGTYAASTGSWTGPDGASGGFVTLWREQKDGSYKWLLDWNGSAPPKTRGDIVEGKVADCVPRGRGPGAGEPLPFREREHRRKKARLDIVRISDPPPADGAGQSQDGTLRWSWSSGPDKRTLTVTMRTGGGDKTVIADRVAGAAP